MKNILRWLEEEKWELIKFENPDFDFAYKITLTNKNEVAIGLEKTTDRITIQKSITLPPDAQTSYKISGNKYNYAYQLSAYLMIMDIATSMHPNYEELQSIDLLAYVYFDGFSRDKLIHSIYKLGNAITLCGLFWKAISEGNRPPSKMKF